MNNLFKDEDYSCWSSFTKDVSVLAKKYGFDVFGSASYADKEGLFFRPSHEPDIRPTLNPVELEVVELFKQVIFKQNPFGHSDAGEWLRLFFIGEQCADYVIWAMSVTFLDLPVNPPAPPEYAEVGHKVQVGGCVGKVREITSKTVIVAGTWIDFNGPKSFSEPWEFTYDRTAFACARWSHDHEEWNAENFSPNGTL